MSKNNKKRSSSFGIVLVEISLAVLIIFLYFFASNAIQANKYEELAHQKTHKVSSKNKKSDKDRKLSSENKELKNINSNSEAVSVLNNLRNNTWTIYWQSKDNSEKMNVIKKFSLNDMKTCHINGKDYSYKISTKDKSLTIKLDKKNNQKSNLVLKNFRPDTKKSDSFMMKVKWDNYETNGTGEKV